MKYVKFIKSFTAEKLSDKTDQVMKFRKSQLKNHKTLAENENFQKIVRNSLQK